jgi:hypothetical protein
MRQPAVEELDAQEAAKATIDRDNCGQPRSADQLRVNTIADASRKMKGQRQTITRLAVDNLTVPERTTPQKRVRGGPTGLLRPPQLAVRLTPKADRIAARAVR